MKFGLSVVSEVKFGHYCKQIEHLLDILFVIRDKNRHINKLLAHTKLIGSENAEIISCDQISQKKEEEELE